MKTVRILLIVCFFLFLKSTYSQTMIINEVSNGAGGNKEWVEFVVVDTNAVYSCAANATPPTIDIRGWIFDDNSGYHGAGGVAAGCVRFSYDAMWSAVPVGTMIVVYNSADKDPAIPADDLSMSDGNCLIVAPVNNAALFEANTTTPGALACSYPATGWTAGGNWNNIVLANTGDCMRLVNLAGCEVFAVAWATVSLNPMIYFSSGGSGTQNVWYFNGGNPYLQTNWSEGNTVTPNNQTPGLPNNLTNQNYINSLNNGCTPISVLVASAGLSSNADCGCNGTASVSASGSIPGYTYDWSPAPPSGQGTSIASGLCAGSSYTCTVTSSINCSVTIVFNIVGTNEVLSSVSGTNVSCFGGSDGSAIVNATGGNGGLTYVWSPAPGSGQGTISASGLSSQAYTITTTDAAGCTASSVFTPTQPVALTATASVVTGIDCNGNANGSVAVSTSGGAGGNTFSWAPSGGTGSTASGLSPGTYTVTITDANSCPATASVTLTEPLVLSASASVLNNAACFDSLTGSSSVSVSGGTSGYTYSWSPSGGSAAVATGLGTGNYTVTVTDANSCSTTASVTITEPAELLSNVAITSNVSCNGGNNGAITSAANGGTGLYTYSWSPGGSNSPNLTGLSAGTYILTITDANGCIVFSTSTITEPSAIQVASSVANVSCNNTSTGAATVTPTGGVAGYSYSWAPSGGNAATANSLSAGIYTVTITDANNCIATSSVTITEPAALSSTVSVTNVDCYAASTGSASVTATGGSSSYSYSWSPSGGSSAIANGLSAGNYTVTITDANNCFTTNAVLITEPQVLSAAASVTNASCNGTATGTATITPSGGTSAYSYSWLPSGGSGQSASSLSVGNYTVIVTDANSCSANVILSVTEPAAINLVVNSTQASCGASNGSVNVSASGGSGAFTYAWSPGGATTDTVNALSAGIYSVTVTDGNSCISTATVSIINSSGPQVSVSAVAVLCNGGNNGSAISSLTGGTSPFTYSWSPSGGSNATAANLSSGIYTVTVTDANYCVVTQTVAITEPAALSISSSATNVSCFGGTNGTATALVSGGSGSYTYSWSPSGGTSSTENNLSSGIYTVSVSDANNCISTSTVSVAQGSAITVTTTVTNVSCFNGSNGSVSASVNGGNGSYSYNWTPSGGSNSTAVNLSSGSYTLSVTDALGCNSSAAATVNNGSNPASPVVSSSSYCQGQSINPLTASGSGGTFSWFSNSSLSTLLATGNSFTPNPTPTVTTVYYVTETSGAGCQSFATADSVIINPLPAPPTSADAVYCAGQSISPLNSNSTGGVIMWYANSALTNLVGTGNSFSPFPVPSTTTVYYLVTVSPAGCVSVATTDTLEINPAPVISGSAVITAANCGAINGTVTGLNVSGGTPVYSYNWTDASGTSISNQSSLTNVGPGNYLLTITDANGCSVSSGSPYTVGGGGAVNAGFVPSSTTSTAPANINFTNTSTGATSYVWTFGDGSANSSQNSPAYTYNATGIYTVTLIATNGTCVDTSTVVILIIENSSIIIPNVFSPNGDGVNEYFFFTAEGISELTCDIYNRWGQVVCKLSGVSAKWDGKSNDGNEATDGTYYYVLKAKGADGKEYNLQGYVLLTR